MRPAEEVRQLASAIRGLPRRRRLQLSGLVLLAAGGLLTWLGGLAAFDLLGIVLVSAGAVAAVASMERAGAPRRLPVEEGGEWRRFAGAVGLFVLMAGTGAYLWSSSQPLEATLRAAGPSAGAPLFVFGPPERKTTPSVDVTLGRFELTPPAAAPPGARGSEAGILIVLPLAARDCPRFEARFGGSCGGSPAAPQPSEGLRIRATEPSRPFEASILLSDPRVTELSHSSPPEQQAVPTAWSLRTDTVRTEVRFECLRDVPFELHSGPVGEPGLCSTFRGESFRLLLAYPGPQLPFLNLNATSSLVADLAGDRFETSLEEGTVQVAASDSTLPGTEPTSVAIEAADSAKVEVDVAATAGKSGKLRAHADRASGVWVGGDQQVANWLARHPEVGYFVAGIVVALLLSELLGLLARRGRR